MSQTENEVVKNLKAQRPELIRRMREGHGKLKAGGKADPQLVTILDGLIFLHELRELTRVKRK